MKKVAVLDASAILAVLQGEPGADKLTDEILDRSVASTVNLAEVQGKLVQKGISADEAWEYATSVIREAEMFTGGQARLAGSLVAQTMRFGLSLGDRSCLALALALKGEVYTTERVWKGLKLGIPIHVIR